MGRHSVVARRVGRRVPGQQRSYGQVADDQMVEQVMRVRRLLLDPSPGRAADGGFAVVVRWGVGRRVVPA